MMKYNFLKTEDGSTGLYSLEAQDIFHSRQGALKEAYEKFVIPSKLEFFLKQNGNIKILDICSGIGYNLKAALSCIEGQEVVVDAIETDSSLLFLSPFVVDGISDDKLKEFLLGQIILSGIEPIKNWDYILQNKQFFSPSMINLMEKLVKSPCDFNYEAFKEAFLHNIYYKYISTRINYHIKDARSALKELPNKYNVIFLDAFSPQKDPTLWTIDFLRFIKSKMYDDSILVSYSKSTPFRSALVQLGFNVGKTLINNIDMGTAASININNLDTPLDKNDFDLISTRSGIVFEDANLDLIPSEIIKNREYKQSISTRLSRTKFTKGY